MASNLFNAAAQAVQKSLRLQFRNTTFGRLLLNADAGIRRGTFSERDLRRLRERLRSMTTQDVADQIVSQLAAGQSGPTDVERYGVQNWVGKAFGRGGPLGKLLGKLLSPSRWTERVDPDRELEVAANLLKSFGYTVTAPGKGKRGPAIPAEPPGPSRLKGLPGWRQHRDREQPGDDDVLTGEMIPVKSSNVHSIGFRLDNKPGLQARHGTLLIRFLGTAADGHRAGSGPMYEYFDVPARVFLAFKRAASKGKFVWDNVRVRGTVSGHRFAYDLAEISQGYVPRQAGLKRGHDGEWYLTRKFRDRTTGKLHTSQLPEEKVRRGGPNRGVRGSDLRSGPERGR